jgi:hypothetical protein
MLFVKFSSLVTPRDATWWLLVSWRKTFVEKLSKREESCEWKKNWKVKNYFWWLAGVGIFVNFNLIFLFYFFVNFLELIFEFFKNKLLKN